MAPWISLIRNLVYKIVLPDDRFLPAFSAAFLFQPVIVSSVLWDYIFVVTFDYVLILVVIVFVIDLAFFELWQELMKNKSQVHRRWYSSNYNVTNPCQTASTLLENKELCNH